MQSEPESRAVMAPRQRFIWPTVWDDPTIGKLSDSHRILYIGCFSLADDEGRIIGEPTFLRSHIFSYHTKSDKAVAKLRDEVAAACRSFHVYHVNGVDYIQFLNWKDFQKPKYAKESSLPPPEMGEPSGKLGESLEEGSSTGRVGLGRVGLGRVVATSGGRERDPIWDTLEEELGPVATDSERGRRNKAVKELRRIGASPDDIRAHCAAYRLHWPSITLTDTGLVSNWSKVERALPAGTKMDASQMMAALDAAGGAS